MRGAAAVVKAIETVRAKKIHVKPIQLYYR
jgi:hypothetical protein